VWPTLGTVGPGGMTVTSRRDTAGPIARSTTEGDDTGQQPANAVLPKDAGRVGQHGLEIVTAVCRIRQVRRATAGRP
jgi:hypothetical protein